MNLFHRMMLRPLLLTLLAGLLAACGEDGPTEPLPLEAPLNLTVTPVSSTSVRVEWNAVSGAGSYDVERATGASGSYASAGTATSNEFTDTGLSADTEYRYRVTAIAGTRRSQPSNPSSLVRTPAAGPRVATLRADITANRTLFADTVYTLSGFVKVRSGATLTIQPGTRIVGDFAIPGSSLFILRGAKIMAEGTAERPIVFTSSRAEGQRQPGDWGGIIIIGNGITNRGAPTYIEGTGTDATINPLQDYSGGTDNNDNSGVLRYVRIEFAGFPTAPNEELNSLTLAAVGRGTRIEYVQVLQGLDDAFEWFGGAVDARYLISYETGDDHFDMSEGYVGRIQNVIGFQSIRPEARPGLPGGVASDPEGLENDGCWAENCSAGNTNRGASQPFNVPVIANFTLIGSPSGAWETTGGNYGMMLRRGTGGLYVNGVIARYSKEAISLRGQDVWDRVQDGRLGIRNILSAQTRGMFQTVDTANTNRENRQFALNLAANGLEVTTATAASLFASLPTTSASTRGTDFNWLPAADSPLRTGGLSDFSVLPTPLRNATQGLTGTTYRGAADPNGPRWWEGWTSYGRF